MTWVKKGWVALGLAGAALLGSGCIAVDYEEEEATGAEVQEPSAVVLQAIDIRNEMPSQANELCECSESACYQDWVESNVGCDVCVAVSCSGDAPRHICVFC